MRVFELVSNYKAEHESWRRDVESKLGIWGAVERKLGETLKFLFCT